ncbi:MAG: hypothetical protein ABJI00_11840 [Paracoccaceae bacterium]
MLHLYCDDEAHAVSTVSAAAETTTDTATAVFATAVADTVVVSTAA